ncbi:MAG: hypothetical protein ACI8QT_001970 [Halioglobus sp.]|jgi:hypothetical protein
MPTITEAKHFFTKVAGALRSGVWVIQGTEGLYGEPIGLLFAGSEKQKAHVLGVAFDNEYNETYLGKLYVWQIAFLLLVNRHECDIAMIEGSDLQRTIYQNKGDYFLPLWLKTQSTAPLPVERSSFKDDLRIIRRFALSYEVTTETDKVDDFYQRMYRPMVNASHGESTIEIDFVHMKHLIAKGQCVLLLVIKESESIAGALLILEETPRLWAIGVRDNKPAYRKYRAGTAAYFFAAEYLATRGYSTVHLGMSRSFLNDGVLQYKSKFNQQIIGIDHSGFILKILEHRAATDSFLKKNPFIYLREKSLYGAVFLDRDQSESEKYMEHLRKKYDIKGLAGLEFYVQDNSVGEFSRLTEY